MIRIYLFSIFFSILPFAHLSSQTTSNSADSLLGRDQNKEIKGILLDADKKTPLPYANIYVMQKNFGVISNETGHFSINITNLEKTDTLRFQYIGYKTKKFTVAELESTSEVFMTEDIINLSETLIFGSAPEADWIVKKVLENKDSNYKRRTSKRQVFIRDREIADIDRFKLNYKKSTISELDRDMIAEIEKRTPKYVTSYTDFLGYLYFNSNTDDSVTTKIDPIRMVMLKEEYLDDLEQFKSIFEGILANTGEEEYWKVKSGVFGQKLDIEEENEESEKDSVYEHSRKTSSYSWYINYQLAYSLFTDKDQWEFLHKTSRYNYKLAGGTRVKGEDVYIIDFTPKRSGHYIGRLYISTETYALIRADYEYEPGKTGTDIHLLGVGYTENQFSGSIYFEKKNENYYLKYFSYKTGSHATVDRSLALMKKRKRFLFDKTLNELKLKFEISVNIEESIEYLVLEDDDIIDNQFDGFDQKKNIEIIYVDQFDDQLWKGFAIIEPTQQMKEYKKQEVNYSN